MVKTLAATFFNRLDTFSYTSKISLQTNILTKKNALPPGGHALQPTRILFRLVHDIIGTMLVTKFHEDHTINVASILLTRENAPPTDIIGTNLLTKFHDGRTKIYIRKNARPRDEHVLKPTQTIFKLVRDIIRMNHLIKFYEDRTINVASREKSNETIFELIQDVFGTNLLTQFNDGHTINVASRVLTRFYYNFMRKNARPPWRPYIIGTNLLNMFHEERTINMAYRVLTWKNAPPPCGHFHDDRKINVASRVLTRKHAPPPAGYIFQPTGIIFNLFHEDRIINPYTHMYSHISKTDPLVGSHVFQKT
ncbi:hypothetical protein DPMN_165056 [Dreissena polymorpha]|uniref:Uncharacterized protein n=1 Tax=Dreissena polymorpha TaxID=45954 RepID=A0A9D4EW73_DREPO|nr:hypothetical protein DPMN_165056 [Dreissena polymorpha]